jgi:hypothetical protein
VTSYLVIVLDQQYPFAAALALFLALRVARSDDGADRARQVHRHGGVVPPARLAELLVTRTVPFDWRAKP